MAANGSFGSLTVDGALDEQRIPELETRVSTALKAGAGRLALDLSAVTFICSKVVGCLLTAQRRAKEQGGEIVLVAPSSIVKRVVTVLNLQQHLKMVPDRAAAAAHFAG